MLLWAIIKGINKQSVVSICFIYFFIFFSVSVYNERKVKKNLQVLINSSEMLSIA